jgi:hypothetical protein
MGRSSAAAATGDMTRARMGTPRVATAGRPPLERPTRKAASATRRMIGSGSDISS